MTQEAISRFAPRIAALIDDIRSELNADSVSIELTVQQQDTGPCRKTRSLSPTRGSKEVN